MAGRHWEASLAEEHRPLLLPWAHSINEAHEDDAGPIQPKRQRLASIDLLRGVIIIIMAWDHCKDFLSNWNAHDGESHDSGPILGTHSEMWYGPLELYSGKPQYLFARYISHFCAPGFSYLMGTGMVLLASSRRRKAGWSSGRIMRYFLLRGIVLVILGFVVRAATAMLGLMHSARVEASLQRPVGAHAMFGFFQVMTCLGLQMMVCGLLIELLQTLERATGLDQVTLRVGSSPLLSCSPKSLVLFVLGCVCMASTMLTIHQAQHGDAAAHPSPPVAHSFLEIMNRVLFVPGPFFQPSAIMAYPLVPWLGVCLWGAAAGSEFTTAPRVAHQRALLNGIILLACFVLIRTLGGRHLNLRGYPMGEGHQYPWNAWWTVCKYPPELAYISITIGADLVLLFLLSTIQAKAQIPQIILKYGRSPLAFYLSHFFFISTFSIIIYYARGRHFGVPLPAVIPLYLFVVFLEYFIVKAYDQFKSSKGPDSLWRLL
ncbi:uncharacterized protein MONBRDRAFT_6697 [Monosiga brevicollis MX1]|uniref:Heparan-alpha-glucosaminide N-acetyltransferase catalytic domain-containing protein n=1 Tax=Monosiga brevicollis TaxID=81824 RepID=A9UV11_MONBE|nr:uncharacterized protein MONBRDRAFT_6697 [Monosiga brevicollis MX1]EDQ90809.1 predicted protein [Monosiga brevicollis MX1]|eukprot:XP_001744106.1 hypothetical protein [Monosiga brevicollis MX1]